MSKKKNTLKDLDEFLKQQAATLVPPKKLVEDEQPAIPSTSQSSTPPSSIESFAVELHGYINRSRMDKASAVCDVILELFHDVSETTPEEKMLINTALYLKNPDDWKNVIRQYWRNKR